MSAALISGRSLYSACVLKAGYLGGRLKILLTMIRHFKKRYIIMRFH